MAITRTNGVVKYPQKGKAPQKKSRKKLRRDLDKRPNKQNPSSNHIRNQLRKIWDFDSRQNRRWLAAKQQEGCVSSGAADILYKWLKAKTPEKEAKFSRPWQQMTASDELKEAWDVWLMLKEERAIAMADVEGPTCADWWCKGGSAEEDEWMEGEDMEHEAQDNGHVGKANESVFEDGDFMSDVDEGEDDDEDGGV